MHIPIIDFRLAGMSLSEYGRLGGQRAHAFAGVYLQKRKEDGEHRQDRRAPPLRHASRGLNSMHWDSATLSDATCLTSREIEVLRLIAQGCTYKQVANRLGVSLHTVASHVKNTYRKLGVRSSAAAVMQAVTMQLLG